MPAFHVETATQINAPHNRVHATLVDFNSWPIWSPWLYLERDAILTYEGTRGEPGHAYTWSGDKIGSGSMSLVSSTERKINYKLRFLKPFKSQADVSFDLAVVDDNKTQVSWLMDSSLPFFMFWMTGKMTAMIRADYGRGLTMLKDYIETGSVTSVCTAAEIVDVNTQSYIGRQAASSMSDIGEPMSEAIAQVVRAGKHYGAIDGGLPFVLYDKMNISENRCLCTTAIPTDGLQSVGSPLISGQLDACRALRVVHTGSHRHLSNGWSLAMNEMRRRKLKKARQIPPFERYLNNPDTTEDPKLMTEIYLPLRA